jgi:hypothetical protein
MERTVVAWLLLFLPTTTPPLASMDTDLGPLIRSRRVAELSVAMHRGRLSIGVDVVACVFS